jgi:tetratricopeptide (TPR) repeat protein
MPREVHHFLCCELNVEQLPLSSEPASTLQRAWQLYRWRRYALAQGEAQRFLARSPESSEAHVLLALCYAKEKRQKDATSEAKEAMRLSPDWSYAHYVMGLLQVWFENYSAANAALLEARRLAPQDPDVYELLADVHYRQGDLHTALATADTGLKQDAEHTGCLYQRGVILYGLNQRDEAEKTFRKVMRIDAEHTGAQGFLGYFAVQRCDYFSAMPLLRNALREDATWQFAKDAWHEALRGTYWPYRWLARVKVGFLDRRPLAAWLVFFVVTVLLVAYLDHPPNREDVVFFAFVCGGVAVVLYAVVYSVLGLIVESFSQFLIRYDPVLRQNVSRRPLSQRERLLMVILGFLVFVFLVVMLGSLFS